jgi:hypothetical protein
MKGLVIAPIYSPRGYSYTTHKCNGIFIAVFGSQVPLSGLFLYPLLHFCQFLTSKGLA